MKVSTLLGISQENLASLLQVSRSQIAMYELGKRSLPVPVMEKLATMLTLLQKKSTNSEVKKNNTVEEQNLLKKLLLKNKHQQLLVERKIIAIEKKQKSLAISTQLVSHLLEDKSNINESEFSILKTIQRKNQEASNYTISLLQLELKKEVLRFEEELLNEKSKNKKQ
jgi:transcriptional regulator with XRE-family HTH domain